MNTKVLGVMIVVLLGASSWWFASRDMSPMSAQLDTQAVVQEHGDDEAVAESLGISLQANSTVSPDVDAQAPSGEPDLELLASHGYTEIDDGGLSDYSTYDIDTLIKLADGGDRKAQLVASTVSNIDVDRRRGFAEAAAAQGFTSALVRFGMSLAIPSPRQGPESVNNPHSTVLGHAYLKAARGLGDPVAQDLSSYSSVLAVQDEIEEAESERLAENIMRRIRSDSHSPADSAASTLNGGAS